MAAMGGHTAETSPQIGQNVLIKLLSESQARVELQRAAHLPKAHHKLQKRLVDVAFGHLLGLDEDDPSILEDAVDIDASLEAAKMQLVEDGFPELSQRLTSLLSALDTCTFCSVQGTQAQELAEKPVVTHFTEHDALLRLFLSLKGSAPSIRRRQTTFQKIETSSAFTEEEQEQETNQHQALTSSVFAEAPNPDALFDLHGTSVLLPSEIFSCNTGSSAPAAAAAAAGALAPENELAELSNGLQSRPTWAPASVQGLPPLYSGDWLPISPALMQMRGDTRKVVPPPSLNVPLSTLAIERTPGSITGFASSSAASKNHAVDRIRKKENAVPAATAPGKAGTSPSNIKDSKTLLGSGSLWTLEESELARDALLSLQGVHSSLLRLRGALAAVHALGHPAAAGILKRIERAASCRHRLQVFIDTFGSLITTTTTNSSSAALLENNKNPVLTSDPVLAALASGLNDVLLSFSQELSTLETSHATEWVHSVQLAATDGGPAIRGKVLQGQGLSLTRVAVLTGKVQTMLRVLCSKFWCNEVPDITSEASSTSKQYEWEITPGPPRGPALLSLLCRYAEEPEDPLKEILHYLFARAAQPYLLFLQKWAWTTTDIDLDHPYSKLLPQHILATQPPLPSGGVSNRRDSRAVVAIPGTLPGFLSHIEAQLLRAGVQLRLLHSIYHDGCRELVATLIDTSSTTAADTDLVATIGTNDTIEEGGEDFIANFYKFSLEGPPVFNAFSGFGVHHHKNSDIVSVGDNATSYSVVDGFIGREAHGTSGCTTTEASTPTPLEQTSSMLILLPQSPLQITTLVEARRSEEERKEMVINAWLANLEAERQRVEAVERGVALGAVALAAEAIAVKEAAKVEALSRRQSQKQDLLKEQLEAIASVQLARAGSGVCGEESGSAGNPLQQVEEKSNDVNKKFVTKDTDIDKVSDYSAEVLKVDQKEASAVGDVIQGKEEESNIDAEHETSTDIAATTTISSTSATITPISSSVVPMSTTIETAFTSTISLQYRLISHACLSFFLDHLRLEDHLSFLRHTFFLEAGDWADEFLKPLSTRIAALQPLSAHSVHGALQDALANSSLNRKSEFVVLGQHLEAEILAGSTTISSFLTCLEQQHHQQEEKQEKESFDVLASGNLPRNRASAPLLVSPTALDGLDLVLLRYKTSWPLAALLTEDTALAYAAVFSAMLRVRRVSAALNAVRGPLAPRLADAPKIRPSPTTTHRVQKLRVFVHSASQLTAAVQYFQGLTTSGPTWASLSAAISTTATTTTATTTSSVSDLQELLEMHRNYVFTSAIDCLTMCGKKELQIGIDAALHAALTVTSKIESAAEAGRVASGPRSTESSWVHTLSNDTTWNAMETSIVEFENAVNVIRKELTGIGVSGPLAGLAAICCNRFV